MAAGMTVAWIPNASLPPASGTVELADLVLERITDLDSGPRARLVRP